MIGIVYRIRENIKQGHLGILVIKFVVIEFVYLTSLLNSQGLMSDGPGAGQ